MEQEQNRAELLNKLRSRMNQSKMGRLNKNQKEQRGRYTLYFSGENRIV